MRRESVQGKRLYGFYFKCLKAESLSRREKKKKYKFIYIYYSVGKMPQKCRFGVVLRKSDN